MSEQQIEKYFNDYKIIFNKNLNSITIIIQKKSNFTKEYNSTFTLNYLKQFKLLSTELTTKNIIETLSRLIDLQLIKIYENNMNIKLIFESLDLEKSKIELILNSKNETKNNLNIENLNLININTIQAHSSSISSVSIFPSGNIISVSKDKTIKIYDIHFNIIQKIIKAHDSKITYVDIKDENNFVTCSQDEKIKTWIKKKNKFKLNKTIEKSHNNYIYKVLYTLNGNIISCSEDSTMKIWEFIKEKNKFQCSLILKYKIISFLLLEDKNILISSGDKNSEIFNLNNFNHIFQIKNTCCFSENALKKLDEDRIIFGGGYDTKMKVFSLSKKKIINEINNQIICYGICVIKNKNLFLTGGFSSDIRIYRCDNYFCVRIIQSNNKIINNGWLGLIFHGFDELKSGEIISYTNDKNIQVWVLQC